MNATKTILVFLAVIAIGMPCAQAQNQNRDQPLEITADNTLEWHQEARQYIARGNAVARQGEVTISADSLTADYRTGDGNGGNGGGTDIYQITARGNVVISGQGATAHGDHAVYHVTEGRAEMTGEQLRLTSPEYTVTARDRFEYWTEQGRLNAVGAARAVRGEDRIDANRLTAIFTQRPDGNRALSRLEAEGNVTITTPEEVLTGARGHYEAASNTAEIHGNVRITRGPNILEGDRATIDLPTNISRIHGSPAQGERVRGIFYPGSENRR